MHLESPTLFPYIPALQGEHEEKPGEDVKDPVGHNMHVLSAELPYDPGGHSDKQMVRLLEANVPIGQASHSDIDEEEIFPVPQEIEM